jgi:hypothetical protein
VSAGLEKRNAIELPRITRKGADERHSEDFACCVDFYAPENRVTLSDND